MKVKTNIKILVVSSVLFGVATTAQSAVFEFGLHTGGDELVSATYTNGSTASIHAGALFSLAVGPTFTLGKDWESRVTIGWKFDRINASNGDVTFSRYPIDALAMYKAGDWEWGGGLTYHLSPKLDGGGVASSLTADFENALGFLLSGERNFSNGNFYVGGRFTSINYKTVPSASVRSTTISGNSIGIVAGWRFGK